MEFEGQVRKKRVALELGGNAAVILHSDWRGSDVTRCCLGRGGQPGLRWGVWVCGPELHQRSRPGVCYLGRLQTLHLEGGTRAQKNGAPAIPADEATEIGPGDSGLWIGPDRGLREGGCWLRARNWWIGAAEYGSVLEPTILTGTKPGMKVGLD